MNMEHARYGWQVRIFIGRLRWRPFRRIIGELEAAGYEVFTTEPATTVASGPFTREVLVTCYSKENTAPEIGSGWEPVRNGGQR